MTLLTASQAATRLNRTERTVRRWINDGVLEATHPTHGRKDKFLIEESEIERLAGELSQEQPERRAGQDQDEGSLVARIVQLEQRLAEIERLLSERTPAQPAISPPTKSRTIPTSATTATYEPIIAPLENLPKNSMPHYRFAELHGIVPRTFIDQIDKGHVPAIIRQKPHRKEKARWLSPEQQRAALQFWKDNETPYHECDLCPHDESVYQRAGQDQEVAATR